MHPSVLPILRIWVFFLRKIVCTEPCHLQQDLPFSLHTHGREVLLIRTVHIQNNTRRGWRQVQVEHRNVMTRRCLSLLGNQQNRWNLCKRQQAHLFFPNFLHQCSHKGWWNEESAVFRGHLCFLSWMLQGIWDELVLLKVQVIVQVRRTFGTFCEAVSSFRCWVTMLFKACHRQVYKQAFP